MSKKYKVKIVRETYVEAENEEEAKFLAYDSLAFGEVDWKVEEDNE
mgnify:FL=1